MRKVFKQRCIMNVSCGLKEHVKLFAWILQNERENKFQAQMEEKTRRKKGSDTIHQRVVLSIIVIPILLTSRLKSEGKGNSLSSSQVSNCKGCRKSIRPGVRGGGDEGSQDFRPSCPVVAGESTVDFFLEGKIYDSYTGCDGDCTGIRLIV